MELDINKAAGMILSAAERGEGGPFMPYAVAYAKHLPTSSETELPDQILYTLNNLGGWRGEQARLVKSYLKSLL